MKKTTIALAVAIASLSTAAFAAPADGTFYFGGKTGWSSFYKTGDRATPSFTEGLDTSRNRVGGGVYLGYQANPYLGFEVGYDWLGKAKYKAAGENVGEFRAQGTSTVIKLSYPITESFDIYTRLGAFIYNSKEKFGGESFGRTSVAPLYAGGIQYNINDDFSARLDYQWVNGMKSKDEAPAKIKANNGLLALGVSYNFANVLDKKPVEVPVIVTPPPAEVQTKETRFVLSDDVLFEFGKATLKDTGRSSLDELVTKLSQLEPTEGQAVVIGHTDRIGSDTFNKKLSLERATSVMNYLVEKGIPSSSISARGEGKSSPVTGTKCNGLKGTTLKACLAPDRRVEIEITGVSQEVDIIEK